MLSKTVPLFVAALFALLAPSAEASPPRLSQMESVQPPSDTVPLRPSQQSDETSVDDIHEEFEQQQNQRGRHFATAVCPYGWLNFRDEQCFFGLSQIQMPFYFGMEACAQIKANFSSVHSMDEFRFIVANFDLRHFWIGIFFGSSNFEDGTKVDQELFEQITPMVPWAPPQMHKGFVCRANPQFYYASENDSKWQGQQHGRKQRRKWWHNRNQSAEGRGQ